MKHRTIDERTRDARLRLALLLGAMQGNAHTKDKRGLIPPDRVLLKTTLNGQSYGITWGELALCAGADQWGGPDDITTILVGDLPE